MEALRELSESSQSSVTEAADAFTEREKAFIATMPANIVGLLAENANRRNVVAAFAEQAAINVAEEITAKYIGLMIGSIETALRTYEGKEGIKDVRDRLDKLRDEVARLHRAQRLLCSKLPVLLRLIAK